MVGVTVFLVSISKAYQDPGDRSSGVVPEFGTSVVDPEAQVFRPENSMFSPQWWKLVLAPAEL